jgi:hypothetical protein
MPKDAQVITAATVTRRSCWAAGSRSINWAIVPRLTDPCLSLSFGVIQAALELVGPLESSEPTGDWNGQHHAVPKHQTLNY